MKCLLSGCVRARHPNSPRTDLFTLALCTKRRNALAHYPQPAIRQTLSWRLSSSLNTTRSTGSSEEWLCFANSTHKIGYFDCLSKLLGLGCRFICGEIDAQNFQDEKFDLILAVGILAHVPSVKGMIEKLSSLLNKDGFLIIQFTDHSNFLSRFNSTIRKMNGTGQYQVNKTRHEEVIKLLDDNHFSIRQMDRYSILLPGFGRFGSKFLYRYTHFTHRTFLSGMGTDVLLLAQKV